MTRFLKATERLSRWGGSHFPTILLGCVYTCMIFMSYNAVAEYTNMHHLFPEPHGGFAMAVVVEGTLLYAFISFRKAPWTAGALLVLSATTTYLLQRWHAEVVDGSTAAMHPLIIAAIPPGAMVLVTWAWHLIRQELPAEQPSSSALVRNVEGDLVVDNRPVNRATGFEGKERREATTELTGLEPGMVKEPAAANGMGSPRQRAIMILRDEPKLSVPEVARQARVSERTVRNAKSELAKEGTG